jgi:hypothetical protein
VTEPPNYQPLDEIESLVRAAKDYVRPSDDLRPRVLETARFERREQHAQRRFWQIAALIFFCGMLTHSVRQMPEVAVAPVHETAVDAGSISSAATAARSSDPSWEMVESFTQLRLRQAQLLRL